MTKTTLIHNGATPECIELIRKLLVENDLKTNDIKNKVICVDAPGEKFINCRSFCRRRNFPFML